MRYNATYKIRYSPQQRRKWEAAAKLTDTDLSRWIRDSLDERSEGDLTNHSK